MCRGRGEQHSRRDEHAAGGLCRGHHRGVLDHWVLHQDRECDGDVLGRCEMNGRRRFIAAAAALIVFPVAAQTFNTSPSYIPHKITTFSATGTYTPTAGMTAVEVILFGGGG